MSSTPDADADGDGSDTGGADGTETVDDGSADATDGGYTHDPDAFDGDGERVDEPVHPAAVDREFDWRGWVLIGVMLLALVVAPLVTYFRPPVLPYWVSLVVMPLIPALLLGVVAVWATTRP